MDTVRRREQLGIAVMGKQADRGLLRSVQNDVQVLNQCKTGSLKHGSGAFVAFLGALHELLHGRLHGPEHVRWRNQTNHFQRPHSLVHLLAGHPQLASIHRGEVGPPRRFRVTDKALE